MTKNPKRTARLATAATNSQAKARRYTFKQNPINLRPAANSLVQAFKAFEAQAEDARAARRAQGLHPLTHVDVFGRPRVGSLWMEDGAVGRVTSLTCAHLIDQHGRPLPCGDLGLASLERNENGYGVHDRVAVDVISFLKHFEPYLGEGAKGTDVDAGGGAP